MGYGIVVQRVLGGRKLGIMRSRRVGWAQADACASLVGTSGGDRVGTSGRLRQFIVPRSSFSHSSFLSFHAVLFSGKALHQTVKLHVQQSGSHM